ncbi:MAG: aminotransferase class V-fold PLP-dependent enzyme, partial [Spirochaeta sp.]|jgi:cysteine desulfurase/selenocysteine lyase|nr:aminotransferase class V-fold PLP-dependent enzyme [Spirochaeta sp.]
VERAIGPRTRIVAVTAMSNVTGYMPPIDAIVERAHAVGAVVLLDGAQYVSHHPTDVAALGCDFLVFSGHKMCGPTGIGVLYGRMSALEEMDPFLFGGDMISRVTLDGAVWAHIPERFEGGTPNIAGAIGLGAAAEFLMSADPHAIVDHERRLSLKLRRALQEFDGLTVYGDTTDAPHGGIVSFNMDGLHPNDIGTLLDQQGIAVRTGFHCAQPFMDHFGITGTVRASFFLYNTEEEVDTFVHALQRVRDILG